MTKKMIVLMLAVVMLLGQSMTPSMSAAVQKANYTLLVYMVGSDLESEGMAATSDLKEMMRAASNAGLNVIVQTGGARKWFTKGVSATSAQRWKISKGKMTLLDGKLGKRNMGKPETLTDFIRYGVTNFPAKQYGLVFWDHGAGSIHGIGADELFNGDSLTLSELKAALTAAKAKTNITFEWIGFDACLMATVETAHRLTPFANYMVASEELEPGHGWDYQTILNAIHKNPSIKGAPLGAIIASGFRNQAIQEGTDSEITLSVTQLEHIPALVAAVDRWSKAVQKQMTSNLQVSGLAKARKDAESFGKGTKPEDNSDMVDLGDLARQTRATTPAESNALLGALSKAVKTNVTSTIAPNATGLSVYFPYWDKASFPANLKMYPNISMTPGYESLIRTFANGLLKKTKGIELPQPALTVVPSADGKSELTQFKIPKNELDDVVMVYSVLGKYIDQDETISLMLGMDSDVDFDENTGLLSSEWSGEWVTLNGSFISMNLDEDYEDYSVYTIPALLNDVDVDLYVEYDYESGDYTIIGAWEGIDEATDTVDRDITKLKKGDVIVPLLEVYDETTDETTYEEGDEVVYGSSTSIERAELPAGAYTFGFVIEDYAQNLTYTDFDFYDVE